MMTTNHNYTSKEFLSKSYSYTNPNNTGRITNRSTYGPYTVIEKDFGDHRVFYYIPTSYVNQFDLSKLDDETFYQKSKDSHSPVVRRRRGRLYHSYDSINDKSIDESSRVSARRYSCASRQRPHIIKEIYYELSSPSPSPSPPSQIIEYIIEDDQRPKKEEIIEYIVRDSPLKQRYIEEVQPIHRKRYEEDLPPLNRTSRTSPIESLPVKPLNLNELTSSRRSKLKQQTPRTTARKFIPQNKTDKKYLSLKEVLAETRAKRGSIAPQPRRELDEEEFHDLPICNKDLIKNDVYVYK